MTTIHVNIVVHRGHPVDAPQYRHTVLWLEFADQSPSLMVHIVGNPGKFKFQSRPSLKIEEGFLFWKKVEVGYLRDAATPAQIVAFLLRVPIDNIDLNFDCQKWVQLALKMLLDAGQLEKDSYDRGLERMWSAIAEPRVVEE